jgi:hypothetical protein
MDDEKFTLDDLTYIFYPEEEEGMKKNEQEVSVYAM